MGTFYRYSADWGRVAAAEVLSERGASAEEGGRPTLLVMSGTKRSKGELLAARARGDVVRERCGEERGVVGTVAL